MKITQHPDTEKTLKKILGQRIMIMDGATGK
jgi:hypothetical protein